MSSSTSSSSSNQPQQQALPLLTFSPTCDLYDQFLDQARVPTTIHWRSYGKRANFCGRALSIACRDDNSRVKECLERAAPFPQQSILVVDGGGSRRAALLGDRLAKAAVDNGWQGILVHGCVRDVDVLKTLDIGIVAMGSVPRKSTRRGTGSVNVPVQIGDVTVQPGDAVFVDNDGVLVLSPEQALELSPPSQDTNS